MTHPLSQSDLLFETGIKVMKAAITAGPNLCLSLNIYIRSLCDLRKVTCSSGSQLLIKLKLYELDNHQLSNYEFDWSKK